jgi:membrane-associated phospholipid phosphatase
LENTPYAMQRIAKIISILGHPFLTIPLYTLIVTFSVYSFKQAAFISGLIVGCFFIPITIWNYVRTKRGVYTNFDVSDQKQRNSMYVFAIPFLGVVLIVFYFTGQSRGFLICILFSLILLILSYVINFVIKCSGHVSLTIFLACMVLPISIPAAIILIICTLIIGWSRVVLNRHTLAEVFTGFLLGAICSFGMLYFQGYFKV